MRLGGPVFDVALGDTAGWVAAHRAAGYRAAYCPLDPMKVDDGLVTAYRDAAVKNDLVFAEVGGWSNPMDADAGKAEAAFKKCCAALELADRLGARCAVNIAGSVGAKWDGPDARDLTPAAFEKIVAITRRIVDAVKPTRAVYTLETMPWMYPDSTESYVALLRAIDRKMVGVHFDPVNLVNSPAKYFDTGRVVREFVAALGDKIVAAHCKDIIMREELTVHLDECAPGMGRFDYPALIGALRGLGDADLPLMLEHLPREAYGAAGAFMRKVLGE